MLHCPHCRQSSFTVWQKLRFGPRNSITCKKCAEKSFVSIKYSWLLYLMAAAIFLPSVGVSIWLDSPWPMVIVLPALFWLVQWYMTRVPLEVLTKGGN